MSLKLAPEGQTRHSLSTPWKFESSPPHHLLSHETPPRSTRRKKRGGSTQDSSGYSRDTISPRAWRDADALLRRLDSHRPGVPRHFPADFTSTEAYCAKLREVRDALIEAEKAGVDHFIYLIGESGYGASELLKIGYSASPANRLQTMQVCTPRKLEIAFTTRCPGPRYDRVIHSILPPKDRRTGEWYLLSPWSWWALEFVFDAEKRRAIPVELVKHAEKMGESICLGS